MPGKETTTRRVVIGTYQTTLDGQIITYTLKRGPRCRHARLEVSREEGLTVVIPKRYDSKRLPLFFENNKRWILYALKKYCSTDKPEKWHSDRDGRIAFLGEYLEVVRDSKGKDGVAGSPLIRIEGKRILISSEIGSNGSLSAAIEDWYRHEATILIVDKVIEVSNRLGLHYKRITIKGMTSRWGSCSVKGNLNFNWKLILTPEPVIDYVVIHELTHIKEMNHSKKFWELVAKECPDWRERRRWLTKRGREFTDSLKGFEL